MSLENKLKLISENCLHGHPVPRSLRMLWKSHEEDDPFVAGALGLKLLTSLEILEDGYGEGIANGDPDILANVRAHRRVFERVGFFAEMDNGELLAFDFETGSATEPPVIELDTEGQYSWKGVDLAEAAFRIAEHADKEEEARSWLASRGLTLGDLGELGSTTQFLPSLKDFHECLFFEYVQRPRVRRPSSEQPADPRDLFTWLLRPGGEVCRAISVLLDLPAGSKPSEFWVWCDGEGRVINVKLPRLDETKEIVVRGVTFDMSEEKVRELLGAPTETGTSISWLAYRLDDGRLWLLIKNGKVAGISVGISRD